MPDYTTKAPGIYIEEIPATGPIAGAGTSTVAFIGPAMAGPIGMPTKVTNWTQYRTLFGDYPSPTTFYTPHAVRGFFNNGGTIAYIVRVGTATHATLNLLDRAATNAQPTLVITALQEGPSSSNILVKVDDASI